MRFIAILFTVGALVLGGIFGFMGMHSLAGCSASAIAHGCSYDRHMLSIALLAFMAAVASLGAILVTRERAH